MRVRVLTRDNGCVGFRLIPGVECLGALSLDHVRASGGVGLKSITCDCNLVSLCPMHHLYKTENGRAVRPLLLAYLERFEYGAHEGHAA
jgi:hypothetical protein